MWRKVAPEETSAKNFQTLTPETAAAPHQRRVQLKRRWQAQGTLAHEVAHLGLHILLLRPQAAVDAVHDGITVCYCLYSCMPRFCHGYRLI
jgi:hypothetical protein